MFSGIVDAVGEIASVRETSGGREIRVRAANYWSGVAVGGSIAVDGVCLTVTRVERDDACFDVIVETLRRSTLGALRAGDRVNLQKSLRTGDAIDGHFVQGHVDAVARVSRAEQAGGEAMWWFTMDAAAMEYVIPKGSIAVDGISLTVVDVTGSSFSVALIPTTLSKTTLGDKSAGDTVNIETDIISRTVVHHLRRASHQGL